MIKWFYNILKKPVPYYANYPLWLILWKPIRKFINVVVIPNIPFNVIRILLYKLIGYSIGKNVFIGMKCYFDDTRIENIIVGDNVVISYCVKFACHGRNQPPTQIVIRNKVYIGMSTILISGKSGIEIGENAIIGAGSVVLKSVKANSTAYGNPAKEYNTDSISSTPPLYDISE